MPVVILKCVNGNQLAARPGSPESLQQLVEIAKSTSSASGQGSASTGKDDKSRLTKDKKVCLACMLILSMGLR